MSLFGTCLSIHLVRYILRITQDSLSGPRLNIKTVFLTIGVTIIKIKRPSYLYYWNPYTGKRTFLYWDGPLLYQSKSDITASVAMILLWRRNEIITMVRTHGILALCLQRKNVNGCMYKYRFYNSTMLCLCLFPHAAGTLINVCNRFGDMGPGAYKLLNLIALKRYAMCINIVPFSAWARYFVRNFKDTLLNSMQSIILIHWKMCILWRGEIQSAPRFNRSWAFLKRSCDTVSSSEWWSVHDTTM